MAGVLYAVFAGLLISVQSVFNARVSEKVGFWITNALVHGSGFVVALLIFWFVRDGSLAKLHSVNKLYLLGGAMGVMIVFTVMKSILSLGSGYGVAVILIAQLLVAILIDSLGLFGAPKLPFTFNKLIGLAIMIAGVVVYKLKG